MITPPPCERPHGPSRMPLLTLELLLATMPTLPLARAELLLPHMIRACEWAEIDSPLRMADWLAQLGHESTDLRRFTETASGWAYDITVNPKLAKRLGNIHPGDGPKFRGHGGIQCTGRNNHRAAGIALGVDLEAHPERAAEPELGCMVAAWYWRTHDLNRFADAGDFIGETRAINGGTNGLPDRQMRRSRGLAAQGL